MTTPLHQLKAEFFKTLSHPARIRVLELLSERDQAVAELLPHIGIEPAHLSQQLAVLRRAGLVTSRREGSNVVYSLTSPQVAELTSRELDLPVWLRQSASPSLSAIRKSAVSGSGTRRNASARLSSATPSDELN